MTVTPAVAPIESIDAPSQLPLTNVAPDQTEPMPPTAAPGAATPANNAAPAQRRTPAHPAHEPAPTPQGSPPIPNKKLPGGRCEDITQRVSLGEPLNDADNAILKRECRP